MPTKKAISKPELEKRIIPNTSISIVDALVRTLTTTHKAEWTKDDMVTASLKTGGVIVINFPEAFSGDFEITHDSVAKEWLDAFIKKESMDITQDALDKTVFNKLSLSDVKDGNALMLGKNMTVLEELDAEFRKRGITRVLHRDRFIRNVNDALCDELTIHFKPYDSNGIAKIFSGDTFWGKYAAMKGYRVQDSAVIHISAVAGENTIPIKIGQKEVGRYYPERNYIIIYFMPFSQIDLKNAESYKDVEFVANLMNDIFEAIDKHAPKKMNNTGFRTRIMVSNFNATARQKLDDMRRMKKEKEDLIQKYEEELTRFYTESRDLALQIDAVNDIDNNVVEKFLEQIKRVQAVPIIQNVTLDNGTVNITFKPTTIKAKLGRNLSGDYTSGNLYEMYIGSITAHIHGNGSIKVSCDTPFSDGVVTKPHPHANEVGSPCLGSGDGPNTMHKLIGERNFADFVYVFWMWIKRWRPEDCYIKPHSYIDDRLKKGLPVFDQAGNRVTLNDKELIAMGELIALKPESYYNENLKKFKDYQPQA